MKKKCATCNFYSPKDKGIVGQCRVNSPTAIPLSKQSTVLIDTEIRSVFPEVGYEDWCGEWEEYKAHQHAEAEEERIIKSKVLH